MASNDLLGRNYGHIHLSGRSDRVTQLAHVSLLDGRGNTFLGLNAGARRPTNSTERFSDNTFVGSYAGEVAAAAQSSVFVGAGTGRGAKAVKTSVFAGYRSGERAQRTDGSVAVGAYSGRRMARGSFNTLLGYAAGGEMQSGSRNTFVGTHAGYSQFSASDNLCAGHQAGYSNRIGSNNVYLGSHAGYAAIRAYENVCCGIGSGQRLVTGSKNVLCGYLAGRSIRNASNCIAIGTQTMELFDSGDTNTCMGTGTARRFTGNNNTVIGGYSAQNAEGDFNTVVGARSMNRRNEGRVRLGNCVIVGENVQFDVPIVSASRTPTTAEVAPTEGVLNPQTLEMALADGESVLLRIDTSSSSPTETLDARQWYVGIGSDSAPLSLDVSVPGTTYALTWGAPVHERVLLDSPHRMRLVVSVGANGAIDAATEIDGVEAPAFSVAAQPSNHLDIVLLSAFGAVRISYKTGTQTEYQTATRQLPGDVAIDVAFDAPSRFAVPPGAPFPFAPGAEVCVVLPDAAAVVVPCTAVDTDARTVTLQAAVAAGGAVATVIPSRFLTTSNAQVVATSGLLTTVRVDGGHGVSPEPQRPAYIGIDGQSFEIFGVASSTDLIVRGSFSGVSEVVLGRFPDPTTGVELAATVPDPTTPTTTIWGFRVFFPRLVNPDFESFTTVDRSTFVDSKTYDIGTNLSQMNADATYDLDLVGDTASLDVHWLGMYTVRVLASLDDVGIVVSGTFPPGTDDLADDVFGGGGNDGDAAESPQQHVYVEVTRERISGKAVTLETSADGAAAAELPLDLEWLLGGGNALTVAVKIRHSVDWLRVTVVLSSGDRSYTLRSTITAQTAPLDPRRTEPAGTLVISATPAVGGDQVQIREVSVTRSRTRDVPSFDNCIYLGSNYTITDEADRSDAMVASLGPNRILRATPNDFRILSSRCTVPKLVAEGAARSSEDGDDPDAKYTVVARGSRIAGEYSDVGDALLVDGRMMVRGTLEVAPGGVLIGDGGLLSNIFVPDGSGGAYPNNIVAATISANGYGLFGLNAANVTGTLDAGVLPQTIGDAATTVYYGDGGLLSNVNVTGFASDARLKTNVRAIVEGDPLDAVARIRGVRFEWREDTPQPMRGTDVGLLAQEVREVLPEAVTRAPFDIVAPSGERYLTIRETKVIPLLVEAINALRREVDALRRTQDG